MTGADARGLGDLFVGEVFEEKGDEGLFERVQFVDGGVKTGNAVVGFFFGGLPRFNRAREVGVLEMNDAAGAGGPFADEGNGGIDGHAIKPGVGELFFFQAGQATPDLEQNFLIQIVLVGGIPGVGAADPENFISILVHQRQKSGFVCGRRIQSSAFI